jgi:hypothetical protein
MHAQGLSAGACSLNAMHTGHWAGHREQSMLHCSQVVEVLQVLLLSSVMHLLLAGGHVCC